MNRNQLGHISLAVAAGGMAIVETALHHGLITGTGWRILSAGFEAGTIGGIADWFAVSALFRYIPIPILGRHTNILVKNRARFSESIVDMVQNKWLSPERVAEKLQEFSASSALLEYLDDPKRRAGMLGMVREMLGRVANNLDNPELAAFLERVLKDQLRGVEFAQPLGRWMQQGIERGDHHQLWEILLKALRQSVEDGSIHGVIRRMLENVVERYAQEGLGKKLMVEVATFMRAINFDSATASIVKELSALLAEASISTSHPIRAQLDRTILNFAQELASGNGAALELVNGFRERMVENADARALIQSMLTKFKGTVTAQLVDPESSLAKLIETFLRDLLRDLRNDSDAQIKLDAWVRDTVGQMVDQNHHVIGEVVQKSLDALSDDELVGQIQEKTWGDLQFIRLNGAIVGGLAGMALAGLKLLLAQ